MTNAMTKPQDHIPAPSDTAAIISVIEAAARNPDVDVDKLERLLQMQERIMDRGAKAAFSSALADMQPNLPVIAERGGISTDKGKTYQSRYALWEDICDAIKPVLSAHGFALSFRVGRDDGQVTVTGVLSHREGHSEETTIYLPADGSGSKNAVQAVGSSTSYGKRYTASALLNLTSRGEDDDGQKAGMAKSITDEQASDLQALMEEVGADRPKFLAYLKVGSIAEIPFSQYDRAISALEAKRVRK